MSNAPYEVVATAGVEKGLRVAGLQLQVARRALHEAAVHVGGIGPAPFALVEIGKRWAEPRIGGGPPIFS